MLKFYCPIQGKRIRRNCGTRDRREARRILRECRERLLSGKYVESNGAIVATHVIEPTTSRKEPSSDTRSWDDCLTRYRANRTTRVRATSLTNSLSRIAIAERIIQQRHCDEGQEGLPVTEWMTLDSLEYLQDRLLAGDESRLDVRAPMTVNTMMGAVMAFVRFCARHGWIEAVPFVEKLDVDDVMKARPVTGEEFERMLEAVPAVVGKKATDSWALALRVLWESGFRIGDLMDFHWEDSRHICPKWAEELHPTIVIPSSQKNGRLQEVPMLPGFSPSTSLAKTEAEMRPRRKTFSGALMVQLLNQRDRIDGERFAVRRYRAGQLRSAQVDRGLSGGPPIERGLRYIGQLGSISADRLSTSSPAVRLIANATRRSLAQVSLPSDS